MSDDTRPPPPRRTHALGVGGRRTSDKLACPRCGCLQSTVIARTISVSEQQTDGYWRRRACGACGKVFPTVETVQPERPPADRKTLR